MAILVLIIIVLVVCSGASGSSYSNSYNDDYGRFRERSRRRDDHEFEEYDSFIDNEGNEHIVDIDGYCEDCDDYHDEY